MAVDLGNGLLGLRALDDFPSDKLDESLIPHCSGHGIQFLLQRRMRSVLDEVLKRSVRMAEHVICHEISKAQNESFLYFY
jgi:hypothetical protein